MTPPAPHARLAPFDLLFVRPVPARRSARARPARAPLVALAAAALLGAHSERAIADWPALVAAVEARVEPEDLLLFDSGATESAYVGHALRADDRAAAASTAPDLAGRRRVWWIRASGGDHRAGAPEALQGWREVARESRPGLEASLLVRRGDR